MGAGQTAIITLAALLGGGGLWFALTLWQRRKPLLPRALFAWVLALGLAGRLAYVFLTPVFYAPDEQSHFNYLKYLSEHHAFPVQAAKLGESDNEWEYLQPPLHYLATLPVYQVMDRMFHHPAATVFALRLCSVLLWLLNVRLGLWLLKRLEVRDDFLWLGVMTLVCLLPTYSFVSSAINNDNLMIPLGTGLLCLMARWRPALKPSLALGGLLGLALWVKQSALIFFPAIALLLLVARFRQPFSWRILAGHLLLVFGLPALLYAPWALRNRRVYGTFTPEDIFAATKTWPSLVDALLSATHNLVKTFWSVSGISNDVGYPFPLLGMGFALLAVAGLALGLKQDPQRLAAVRAGLRQPIGAALAFGVFVNVTLVLRYGCLFGMGQGRHLFPLLYPVALVLVWGLPVFPLKNLPIHFVGFWTTYALAFEAFSLCRFPR
jgi:hypothetical protein